MASRILTWAFYLAVLYLVGVWTGLFSSDPRTWWRDGEATSRSAFAVARHWVDKSIGDDSEVSATASPTPKASAEADLKVNARLAFARGDVTEAIELYRQRLQRNPDDVDASGELANVYLSAGRLQESAQAFYLTARLLAQNGALAQAHSFVAIIRRSDGALADKLEAELKASPQG